MIENARAHLARRLAEAEYLDERDSLRREHKEPGIGCSIVEAETGLFDNLPPDVAIEIDAAADHTPRIEHAGRKVNTAGTGGMGVHHAPQKRTHPVQETPPPQHIATHARAEDPGPPTQQT